MKKIILLFGLMLIGHIYAQSPLSRFNAVASGANMVNFSSTSDGNPTSFLWEFTGGNPFSSTISNPNVSYSAAGIYTAKLTVTNASGSSVSVRTIKVSAANILDLGSGRNDDGTLMSDASIPDPDWTYTDPNGVVSTPVTRYAATAAGWSSASTGGIAGITRWITGNNVITGDHYYVSKEFEIPAGVSTAVLNLRSLSFVRNWTYLVKKNADGTETDTQITATTWMSDGAKGWLNSRSPEVVNYPLAPGKYYIKVKSYTNNTGQRQAIDVNANVNFGYGFTFSPIAEFSATPTSTFTGSNVQFTNLSQGTPISTLWNFGDGANVLTSTQNNPVVAFSTVGNHYAELSADYGNSLISSLKIDNYVQTSQIDAPVVSATQPNCSVSSGSITVTSPLSGVTYSFDNGNTFQISNTISGLSSGNYQVKVKNQQGTVSQATNVTINSAPAVPMIPVITITQPTCTVSTGGITVTSPALGMEYSFDGGVTYQTSNTKNGLQAGTYQIMIKNSDGCTSVTSATINAVDCRDWTKAPNSYVFDPNQNNDGFYIPVKKAYAMWKDQDGLLNDATALDGIPTAEVYWEDVAGLIRSTNYNLVVDGSGENARIKVEIDKAKGEGNAVVALKINNKIIWSWHVWVTDDPSNGVTYGNLYDNNTVNGEQRAKYVENGVVKSFIPKWMDRNLGATNRDFIGYDWNKSGGLTYQWGRKDPFPPFEYKDSAKYEISGTIGTKKHLYDYTGNDTTDKIASRQRPFSGTNDINNNVKFSINNPLDLIFTNIVLGDAWFAQSIGNTPASRKKADLWGDNSENIPTTTGGEINVYKPKTSYDPCPNKWRIPSYITNAFSTNVSNSMQPWGRNRSSMMYDAGYKDIKPTAENMVLKGIKIYPNLGMDFTNTTSPYSQGQFSRNMGVYPGNGKYVVGKTGEFYHQDPHETSIHSASVANTNPYEYFFYAYGDAGQMGGVNSSNVYVPSHPDPALYPNMFGKYYLNPQESTSSLGAAMACRCIEDKYANEYDFPTSFFTNETIVNYTEGIKDPNSYLVTRTTTEKEIKIPISKAFSVYNQYLSDHGMLDFSNLKVNVYWSDNRSLISNIKVINTPTSRDNIKDAYISVKVASDQSGNAVVSLHNGNISTPAYWSWHIWVTNTNVDEVAYQTEDVLLPPTANYVNFTNSGAQPMKNTFMDRNLGATDVFPDVVNPESVDNTNELPLINGSAGMQYQWGRKDPIPSFITTGVNISNGAAKTGEYSIWTSSGPDANGNIYPSSFTELTGNTYENTYVKQRGTDYGTVGITKAENIMNNLKYSVENPLAFMIPGTKYTNRSTLNSFYGQDWLYSTPNQMMDRWGHATSKSVFDPCPGGWRVPDISNGVVDNDPNDPDHLDDNKGSSPWYNGFYKKNASVDPFRIHSMGIAQEVDFDIKNPTDIYNGGVPYYLGNTIKNASTVYGYQFGISNDNNNPNSKYKIGNYPVTGFRGFSNNEAVSASIKLGVSGVWTAALRSANSYGTAHNLTFWTNSLTSSKLTSMNDAFINHPMNAMNVRCVKEESKFGQLLGTASNIGKITGSTPSAKSSVRQSADAETDTKIDVYPNPFNSFFMVKGENLKSYELYDISGKLVKQGSLKEKTIQANNLIKGEYILKITTNANTIKIKKILKN
ncbi:hypothetical protein DRF60_07935 [Chryseobacterium elymi]|uniref:PKD domain-containing protein n=1 Tax=Chryseobacterium elymi TaxID=395936 RepID=A0A3D9DMI2_9FLAO|nr:PKD domain-containing protein [Chryseobacterium elymi]REC79208.1 hypothetical protein DRF60_07935 [Chryseobacterium elymi]